MTGMGNISVELWGLIQVIIDVCLVGLFVTVIYQIRSSQKKIPVTGSQESMEHIERVLKESKTVAEQFHRQLEQKQQIIKRINDGLDSKIVGINLLINRAENVLHSQGNRFHSDAESSRDICELQEDIMALSDQGLGPDVVAKRLGVAQPEVDLVVGLRKKFKEMGGE